MNSNVVKEWTEEEKEEIRKAAQKQLRGIETIYTVLKHKKENDYVIELLVATDNYIWSIDHLAAPLLWGYDEYYGGCRVSNCIVDPGSELIYYLGQALFDNGFYFKHIWL